MINQLQKIQITRLKLPLKVPYMLAFGAVEAFDTLIVEVHADGRSGLGEATLLEGYTTETIDFAWDCAIEIGSALIGHSGGARDAELKRHVKDAPFTTCMFQTAAEMAGGHWTLQNSEEAQVPLLFGLNPKDLPGIEKALGEACAGGYDTVKVKVGFDVDKDLERVAAIQRINGGRQKLRIDGNQGYNVAEAVKFATSVAPDDIELLEQPCHMSDWDGLKEVARHTVVPLMLDESIYDDDDIDRAAEIGASYVKLKLMKLAGIDALCAGIRRIEGHGMGAVLGNGVASDIGCWMELCVARDFISNAGEMNGFLRPTASVVRNPLKVVNGSAVLPAGYHPQLDYDSVAEFTVEQRTFC